MPTSAYSAREIVNSVLPDFVLHWTNALGASTQSVTVLRGGMNSRVFSCAGADKTFLMKGYQPIEGAQRDRFVAEAQFLEYANQVANSYVPNLLSVDDERRCIVMEYLVGEAYAEGSTPRDGDIDDAVRFFSLLNQDHSQAVALIKMDAADGFLKISEHLENVRERLNEMSANHLPLKLRSRAEQTIQLLRNAFGPVEALTRRALFNGLIEDALTTDKRCVSPSDFGFHNAIKTSHGIKFFDFEFGGWDDPAKTILDFTLQPKVPTRQYNFPLLKALNPREQRIVFSRANVLKPILELKWASIIAGFLRPLRYERLLNSLSGIDIESFMVDKLDQTLRALEREMTVGIH
jgi:hypothetical protein